jgi:hypothetical protein
MRALAQPREESRAFFEYFKKKNLCLFTFAECEKV